MHVLRKTVRNLRLGYLILNAPKPVFQPQIIQPILQQPIVQQVPIQIQPQFISHVVQPIIYPTQVMPEKADKKGIQTAKTYEELVGYDIPIFSESPLKLVSTELKAERPIKLEYPLIPQKPEKGERILAAAKIEWNSEKNRYIYTVMEPTLNDKIKSVVLKVKELIEQKLDIDFSKLKKFEAVEYLHKNIDELLTYYSFNF